MSDPRWSANTVDLLAGHLLDPRRDRWGKQNPDTQQLYRERAVGVLGLLAEAGLLLPMAGQTRQEGICGAEHPKLFVNCAKTFPVICVLSHGHDSAWHEADTGERWRPRAEVAP